MCSFGSFNEDDEYYLSFMFSSNLNSYEPESGLFSKVTGKILLPYSHSSKVRDVRCVRALDSKEHGGYRGNHTKNYSERY